MEVKLINPPANSSNVYVLVNGKSAVVIDCGLEAKPVFDYLDKNEIKAEYLLLTHGHYDHCFCAADYKTRGIKIFLSSEDLRLVRQGLHIPPDMLHRFKLFPVELLSDNAVLNLCGMEIKTLFTPGHTGGSYSFICQDYLFSGDTLFMETVGRMDLPTGDRNAMKLSIERLFNLDDDLKVMPGHGKSSTIEHEKKYNVIAKNL